MIKDYEELRTKCDKAIQLRVALERLETNEDFKLIIKECFCNAYPVRCLNLSTQTNIPKDYRDALIFNARATSVLQRFLETIKIDADTATEQLKELNSINEEDN